MASRAEPHGETTCEVRIPPVGLEGSLVLPERASAVVLFAHGSGSSRLSPRNQRVARSLRERGLATLLFDLLSDEEAADRGKVFDIALLAERLLLATRWLRERAEARDLRVGYFGASTGAAAALVAAARSEREIGAVVSRGGRPDLARPFLSQVRAPTLLVVGGRDAAVLELNRAALAELRCEKSLAVVPGATHLFEEPGALEQVMALAGRWLSDHLGCREGAGLVFRDREQAGRRLAEALVRFRGRDPVVLALPRGGVPVAFEIARSLGAPLDLVLVRKIGAPFQPELAVAAVVDGEKTEITVNEDLVRALALPEGYVREQAAREVREIERRPELYLRGRERVGVDGKTAVIVDDGIATGATIRAALRAVRRRHPSRLVLAVPVAPPDTVERLCREADEVVCLSTPADFGAIGQFYADFRQVGDDEVRELLERAARPRVVPPAPAAPVRAPGIEAKVAFLREPEAYAEQPRGVEVVETHMSWVFLTERHAYKLKKPVRYDSLDFSTPELRRADCEAEVRLNRRLAGDVYLGTVALTVDPDGRLALGGGGAAVDWLVHMRRLPADRMLDALIRRGRLEETDVRPAAQLLARFFARARPVELGAAQYRQRLEEGVRDDRRELCAPEFHLPRERVVGIADAQLACLARHAELFDRRVEAGRIIEGHGDLRPEHICLVREPAIIDCLEFSRDLRLLDPADELAFLGLECERLGRAEVGRWFLGTYRAVTGDEPPAALLRFHRTYRALRRAKIAVWHLKDPSVRDPEAWCERARRYLELASAEA